MELVTQAARHDKSVWAVFSLVLCAFIWGMAFAAQKSGMDAMGPLLFVGARFGLALLSIVAALLLQYALWRWAGAKVRSLIHPFATAPRILPTSPEWKAGSFLAVFFVIGMATQQMGLVYTSVANSAFITGFYVVLVPVLGLLHKQTVRPLFGIVVFMALAGLFFLCFPQGIGPQGQGFKLNRGDLLTLFCALAWALHVYYAGVVGHWGGLLRIAGVQFFWACVVGLLASLYFEPMTWEARSLALREAWFALAYTGILAGGVAFFLQLYGQQRTPQNAAAIVLSSEVLFGALAGWWFFDQALSSRGWLGGTLMVLSMIFAQLIDNNKADQAYRSGKEA